MADPEVLANLLKVRAAARAHFVPIDEVDGPERVDENEIRTGVENVTRPRRVGRRRPGPRRGGI